MNYTSESETMVFELTSAVPHCPVVLVLDTSHSMWGQGLTDMMASIRAFCKTIADVQFSHAQVDIAAVSMGDNLCLLEDFTPLRSSRLPNRTIRPKGDTPIGAALDLAREALQAQIVRYQDNGIAYVTPNLILLSDGKSTDDFKPAAARIRESVDSGKLVCRAIALGCDADMTALAYIAGEKGVMTPDHGGMRQTFAEVGQMVSQTYEDEAQDVMMDQTPLVSQQPDTEYLLDGSNILHWDERRNGITLKHLLAITEYLEKKHLPFQVFFDATAPHILKKYAPLEAGLYEKLLKDDPQHYCQVPAGTRADDFLLLQADATANSIILTQDLFRDHAGQYPWLRTGNRVIPGMVMNHVIFFPKISMQIPVIPPEKTENSGL